MPDINDLRRARKAAADKMEQTAQALSDLEAKDDTKTEDLTAAQEAFDAAQSAFDKAHKAVERAEQVEAAQASAAAPVEPTATGGQGAGGTGAPAAAAEPGLRFARMMRTIAAADGNMREARAIADENGDGALFANQNVTTNTSGGFLVPEDVADEVIELLRPQSVVIGMGVRVIPLPNGNLTTNRRKTGANFGYGEENDDIAKTGYTYGQMKLSVKKLTGLIPISNDLLRFSSTAVDRMIRDDMLADAGQAMDRNFLRGSGVNSGPLGLRFQLVDTDAAATNILTMTAAPDIQKVDNDLGRMELALANANIPVLGAHWIGSPRTANYLRNLRDGNGNKVYPEMSDGRLRNKPFHETTEIPDNLGGGTESELMLVAPRHVVVGEANGINIAMSAEAAYKDENLDMQSAFSRDETLMRMIMQHDIGLRHLTAVSIMTGLTWGA